MKFSFFIIQKTWVMSSVVQNHSLCHEITQRDFEFKIIVMCSNNGMHSEYIIVNKSTIFCKIFAHFTMSYSIEKHWIIILHYYIGYCLYNHLSFELSLNFIFKRALSKIKRPLFYLSIWLISFISKIDLILKFHMILKFSQFF